MTNQFHSMPKDKVVLDLADHADPAISTVKLPVEMEHTNQGQIWLLFGTTEEGDDRAAVMIEHYNGQLVVRTYASQSGDEPKHTVTMIDDVDDFLLSTWSVSIESSGDEIKGGFKSEAAAYEWLDQNYDNDIDGYMVEKNNREED